MEKIERKVNGWLNAAAGSMAVMILLGLVFVLAPAFTLGVLHWGIAILLLVAGAGMIARDLEKGRMFSLFSTSLLGIFLVLMGIIVAMHPETLNIVTIAFGAYMIINSFMSLNLASNIKGTSAYGAAAFTSIIGLICGIIMVIHPGDSNEVIIMIAGILLIIYGISGLIDTFILRARIDEVKKNVKKAKKTAKDLLDDAKEAEVVNKKKK